MEGAVSSRKKTSAAKSRGRKDHPASEVGDSEDGAVSRRNEEVCDNDSESPPPLASKVAHSTACQDGTALLPKRSRTADRGETFDDNRRKDMEVEPQSTEAASAVVSAPQVVPSTPVYAPVEVRSSGSCTTETKESETTEMGPAVPQEMPSAFVGKSGVECNYRNEVGTSDPTGTPSAPPNFPTATYNDPPSAPPTFPVDTCDDPPSAPPTFPVNACHNPPSAPPTFPLDTCDDPPSAPPTFPVNTGHDPPSAPPTFPLDTCEDPPSAPPTFPVDTCEYPPSAPATFPADTYMYNDPCGFPATYDGAPTSQTQVSSCQVTTVLEPMACGYDVLGRSNDVGRYYPEISGIFDHRTRARPLSEDQVLRLYGGTWLNGRKGMVADFVTLNQEKNLNRHSLYVLLANYLRSRELLSETTSLLEKLREEMAHCESNVWDMVSASVTGSGSCGDNKQFSGTHRFNQAQYNGAVASRLASCSQQMHALLREKHVVCMHNVNTIRVQIDYHIQLVVDGASLGGMQSSTPVTFKMHPEPNCDVSELKSCISVLFLFLRKGAKDKAFVDEVQSWLQMLSNLLLRVASLADHFFLLNHVLCCPPGIHKWAVSLVQVPNPLLSPEDSDCNQMLDYALTVLATILSPVKAFKEYLQFLQKNELASALSCRESDVVALLNQVPFIDILNLLHATTWTSEQHVLEAIAVASQVISILHTGLYTYSGPRYKHLSKKIARLISLAMHSVADLWKSFQPMHDKIDPAHLAHLQVEYDQLFLRAVNGIYHSQGTGAWQFMVGLPYASISAAATWQVLWLLHKSHEKDPHEICLSPLEICHELRRRNQRLSFNERLSQVPHSEIFFLMTALVDMADSPALAYIVAVDVFEVTYLNMNLRSSLAKDGRDLLSALALKQPFVVSVLLDAIENHMLILGAMSCYLMDAMPLELWHPDKEDLDIVAHFLLCYPLDSPQSLLARMLIDALNYGKNEQGQLYLERSLHQFVGVLLLESYKKFCSDSVHKQARYLPFVEAGTCKSSTPTDFGSWVWNILFKLKLHAFDSNHHAQLSLVVDESPPLDIAPDLQEYEWLQPVAHAADELLLCGIFLSLSISRVGHCREQVLSTGLKCISTLVLKKQYAAAIKCLSHVLPLFYMRQEMLLANQQFLVDLQTLVFVDSTCLAAVRRLAGYEHERCVLGLLAGTMAHHVKQAKHWGFPSLPVRLWASLLLHLPNIAMHKVASKSKGQSDVMYLLDTLAQLAYFEADCLESVVEQLAALLNNLAERATAPLTMKTWPTVVPFDSAPSFPWFALVSMLAEAVLPSVSVMWEAVLRTVTSHECTAAVKKAMQAPLDVLLLYRWARQALVTDAEHPALPLIWQQFFFLYLQRCPDGGSSGPRLFKCGGFSSLLKKVKQRVTVLVDHFSKCSTGKEKGTLPKILCERLLRVYRAFGLWLEDKQVLGAGDNLASLPSQYCPEILCATLQGNSQLWHELVSMEAWRSQLQGLELAIFSPAVANPRKWSNDVPAARKAMIFPLRTHDKPIPAPHVPRLIPVIPPAPLVASEVRELVASQMRALQDQAVNVNGQLDRLAQLDEAHQTELLPALYKNVMAHVTLVRSCGSDCSGAVYLNLTFYEARQDPEILLKVKQNRTEWLATVTVPAYASCCAIVQLEACLTQLVQRHRQALPTDKAALEALGSDVFFDMVRAAHKEITSYSPTRQFVTLCLDMLGQEFVSNKANQCLPVLQAMLRDPGTISHVSPFFTPAAADDEQYVHMYHLLSSCLVPALHSPVFALLSKFALPHWLKSHTPSRAVRGQLLVSLEMMLRKCGHNPEIAMLPLVELLCSHLRSLLQFSFPQQYAPVVTMLLRGTSSCSVPVVTWNILIEALHYSTSGSAAQTKDANAKNPCTLSLDELTETLAAATAHFSMLRTSDASLVKDCLYGTVTPYLLVLGDFFSVIVHNYIWKKVNSPKDDLQEAVKSVLQLYGPWLELTQETNAHVPWLPRDTGKAVHMAHSLVDALTFFHGRCCNVANISVMSLVWQHYFVKYVWTNPPQYITDTVQAAFYKLPWSQFSASVEDVRLACKLLDVKYAAHQTFLAQVFVQVPWQACLCKALHLAPELLVDYCSSFAELVLGLAWHPNMSTFIATSLGPLREHNWEVVPVNVVWRLQKVFASSCNVHQLLKLSPGIEKTVLEFVATLSCMHRPGSENDSHKQHAFVSTLVGLYSSALDVADAKDLVSLLPHLLDSCENVQGPVVLLGRALSLLDSCQEGSPQAQALVEGLLPWLEARAGQPILLSVLTAACINVASVQQLVRVTEACLTAFLEGTLVDDGGWAHAVTALQVPELTLTNFLEQCICQAAHLTQLIYVLHCLPRCCSLEDEWTLLDQLANWVSRGCATCTSEASEPKLLLLWFKLLVLSVRQLDFGDRPEAVRSLLAKFCSALSTLGEDRDTSGLLGALGMGRRSVVSAGFRLCCRAVAAFVASRLDNSSALANQTLSRLRSLQTSKAYLPLSREVQESLDIVRDASRGAIRDSLHLMNKLVNSLYREKVLLRILVFWQRAVMPGGV